MAPNRYKVVRVDDKLFYIYELTTHGKKPEWCRCKNERFYTDMDAAKRRVRYLNRKERANNGEL